MSASPGLADDEVLSARSAELQARLGQLEGREDAKYVMAALEQARRALERKHEPRALRIARASMVLAERQLERRQVQAELLATQRRLTAVRERAQVQRRALEALMRDRATLVREGAPR